METALELLGSCFLGKGLEVGEALGSSLHPAVSTSSSVMQVTERQLDSCGMKVEREIVSLSVGGSSETSERQKPSSSPAGILKTVNSLQQINKHTNKRTK